MLFKFTKKTTADTTPKTLVVVQERCPQNHPCPSVRVCPTGALQQTGMAAPTVNQAACTSCGRCVRFCPKRALMLK